MLSSITPPNGSLVDSDVVSTEAPGRDQAPVLTEGSPEAAILYEVWSGERIVYPGPSGQFDTDSRDRIQIATIVATHLHLRAGYTVNCVATTKAERIALYRSLRQAAPNMGVTVSGVSTAELGEEPNRRPHYLEPTGVSVRSSYNDNHPPKVDLVISVDGNVNRNTLVTYLMSGQQLLVLGWNQHLSQMELGSRSDTDVPLDVVLAGAPR